MNMFLRGRAILTSNLESVPQQVEQSAPDAASPQHIEAYVKAALAIQGYTFSETRIADVVQHFTRIEQLSRAVRDADLPPEVDSAPIFTP